MRKILFILSGLALFLVSCQHELQPAEPAAESRFVTVQMGLSQTDPEDSRSMISIQADQLRVAYLFAFQENGDLYTYPATAGDMQGQILTLKTREQSFNWALPVGETIRIYTIVNPTDTVTLDNMIADSLLTEQDVLDIDFECSNTEALMALDPEKGEHALGLPMSGYKNVYVESDTQSIIIPVKRLFARFELSLDWAAYEMQGYKVNAVYISSSKCNTQVPYFCFNGERVSGGDGSTELGGFKQGDPEKFNLVDLASREDLRNFTKGQQITLYCLENCQGIMEPAASHWTKVYSELGSAVSMCTYVEIGINFVKEGIDETKIYRIYLGPDDMRSNFNVHRNVSKPIRLILTQDLPAQHEIAFDHSQSATFSVGETKDFVFGYSGFDESDKIECTNIAVSNNSITHLVRNQSSPVSLGNRKFESSGYVTVKNNGTACVDSLTLVGYVGQASATESGQVKDSRAVESVNKKYAEYVVTQGAIAYNDNSIGNVLLHPKYSDMDAQITISSTIPGFRFGVYSIDDLPTTPVLTSEPKTFWADDASVDYVLYYYYEGDRHEKRFEDEQVYTLGSDLPVTITLEHCDYEEGCGYEPTNVQDITVLYKFIGFCYADEDLTYKIFHKCNKDAVDSPYGLTDGISALWISDPKNYGWSFYADYSVWGLPKLQNPDSNQSLVMSPTTFSFARSFDHTGNVGTIRENLTVTKPFADLLALSGTSCLYSETDVTGTGSAMFLVFNIPGNYTISDQPYKQVYGVSSAEFNTSIAGSDSPWCERDYIRHKNAPYKQTDSELRYCLDVNESAMSYDVYDDDERLVLGEDHTCFIRVVAEYDGNVAPDRQISFSSTKMSVVDLRYSWQGWYNIDPKGRFRHSLALIPDDEMASLGYGSLLWSTCTPWVPVNAPAIGETLPSDPHYDEQTPTDVNYFRKYESTDLGYCSFDYRRYYAPGDNNPEFQVNGHVYGLNNSLNFTPSISSWSQVDIDECDEYYFLVTNWTVRYSDFH